MVTPSVLTQLSSTSAHKYLTEPESRLFGVQTTTWDYNTLVVAGGSAYYPLSLADMEPLNIVCMQDKHQKMAETELINGNVVL